MELLTYDGYARLLEAFRSAGYAGVTVRTAATETQRAPLLVLRHDVEWNPRRALPIADADCAHGLQSTFYFRVDTRALDPDIMHGLQEREFEIGYHYNTLDRCRGDHARAIALFEHDVCCLREAGIWVASVKCHGNPRVKKVGYDTNWDVVCFDPDLLRRNGLLDADVCLQSRYPRLAYVSDVGIHWSPPQTLDAFIGRIKARAWPILHLATHPDYWSRSAARAFGLQLAARALHGSHLNAAVAAARHAVVSLCAKLGNRATAE